MNQHPYIFTARKRSLLRLYFYTCLSVILFTGGVCLSAWWDTHTPPRNQTPTGKQTPMGSRHPQKQTPPLHSACWEIRATSGRYASYWNAYLLILIKCYEPSWHGSFGRASVTYCVAVCSIPKSMRYDCLITKRTATISFSGFVTDSSFRYIHFKFAWIPEDDIGEKREIYHLEKPLLFMSISVSSLLLSNFIIWDFKENVNNRFWRVPVNIIKVWNVFLVDFLLQKLDTIMNLLSFQWKHVNKLF